MSSQPPAAKYDFLTCVNKSGVISADQLATWLDGKDSSNPNALATQMTDDGLLTAWQAKYLLSGRYRLHLGNYTLLNRVSRDHFGDRFIANHAQLGRQVILQVLPVELTNDDEHRERFLKKASLAGELNHPNLVHVIDIDRQQGRYFLVTEHFDGSPLSSVPAATFDATQIAKLTRDGIAALRYAHQRDVVHGNVTSDCLLLSDDHVLKIGQIALSPLSEASDSVDETQPASDLKAFTEIVKDLSKECPALASKSEATAQLRKLLAEMPTADPADFSASVDQLTEWIDANEGVPAFDVAADSPGNDDLPKSAVPGDNQASFSGGKKKSSQSQNPQKKSRDKKRRKPWWLAVALVGLLGIVFLIQSTYFSTVANQHPKELRTSQSPATFPTLPSPDQNQPPEKVATADTVDRSAATLSPDDDKPLADGMFDLVLENESNDPLTDTQPGDTSVASTEQDSATESIPINDANPAETGAVVDEDKADSGTIDTTKPAKISEANAADDDKSEKKPNKAPLESVPDSVDLPLHPATDPVVLVELDIEPNQLLGLSLLSPPIISKTRLNFDLQRLPDDKQRWNVLLKRRTNDDGEVVGQFHRSDTGLEFAWTPSGAENKLANYLRNCMLKLTLLDKTAWLIMRKPLKLEDFTLTDKQPYASIDSAVEWLPQADEIVVELLPWSKGMPDVWIEPTTILQTGQPAAIHFHEAAINRIFWIIIQSDLRSKLRLQAQPVLLMPGGGLEPVKKIKIVEEYAESMKHLTREAENLYAQNAEVVAPQGHKTKFKDYVAKLKSNAKKAGKQADIAALNVQIMNNLVGRPIPLQIYFNLDEHRIVLANTTNSDSSDTGETGKDSDDD